MGVLDFVKRKIQPQQIDYKQHVVRVGLLGLGTVGTGVVQIIESNKEELFQQTGSYLHIEKALVKDVNKEREIEFSDPVLTENPDDVINNPDIDIIIEVMGGIEPARTYVMSALEQGKHVVTANKDLLALHGGEVLGKASEQQCDVFYEASVAGGIPIIRVLMDSFASDRILKMMGIVNGTTNYILTKMSQEGAVFEDVLRDAQSLGYAEADPTADIEGLDAARKMTILSTLGFYVDVDLEDVYCEGITNVLPEDFKYARQAGYEIKLLGIADRKDDSIEISVQPTMIRNDHPLAAVNGVFNAVYVYGEAVGETMFYGPGAGGLPTATAVVSDLVSVVKNMKMGVSGRQTVAPYVQKKIKTDDEIICKYFMRLHVQDQAGVLAKMTQVLADDGISMQTVFQQPVQDGKKSEIIMITYETSRSSIQRALDKFKQIEEVIDLKSLYRVEDGK